MQDRIYFKIINGKRSEPLSLSDFEKPGSLFKDDLIWHEDLADWTPAEKVEELRELAIKRPPKTGSEVKLNTLKKSLVRSFIIYLIFSLFLGIFGGSLELYQYKSFVSQTTQEFQYGGGVPMTDVYVRDSDGTYSTRWSAYLGGGDNEQITYDRDHSFWFRPYRAIYDHVPLSKDERESTLLLLANFIGSSLVSSLWLLVILVILNIRNTQSNSGSSQEVTKHSTPPIKSPPLPKKKSKLYVLWIALGFIGVLIFFVISNGMDSSPREDTPEPQKTLATDVHKNENLVSTSEDRGESDVTEEVSVEETNDDNLSELDKIYLGTNLFHEGSGGVWGRATITKQGDHYWIKGAHTMADGDWVRIEGKILNPRIDGFTFDGTISAYSPSSAESVNEYEFLRKDKDKVYGDTCIWTGRTEAYKLFKGRKYWRIKTHDCYHYTTDIDIFHN